jgi:hypothetical protein
MKNHQPRLRVVAWMMLNSKNQVGQASLPAGALGPIIRMEGIDTAGRMAWTKFALDPDVCMTLKEVEQRRRGQVKKRATRDCNLQAW